MDSKSIKGARFVDSAVFKALAALTLIRGGAALYALYVIAGELIDLLTEQRLLGDIYSYGFNLALLLVRMYIVALHALLGAGAFLLLLRRRKGARLCRGCYLHLRIAWVLFAFGINYIRINSIFTVEYLIRTAFIDACFVLLVLYCGNFKRAMDDISYELLGYNAEYCSTRALTGQAMLLGIASMIEIAVNGHLYILVNITRERFEALYDNPFFVFVYYALALLFFTVSFANTALRKHIRAKYLCLEANRPYAPAFQPMTAVLGALAAACFAFVSFEFFAEELHVRIYYGVSLVKYAAQLLPYALLMLPYALFALALAGMRRNLLTVIGAAAELAAMTVLVARGGLLPLTAADTFSIIGSLVWWALVLLAAVSALALGRLPEARTFPKWLRMALCLLAAALFVPVFVNAYLPLLKTGVDPVYYGVLAALDLTVRVTLMLHLGGTKQEAPKLIQT